MVTWSGPGEEGEPGHPAVQRCRQPNTQAGRTRGGTMIYTAKRIRSIYSQKRNCAASVTMHYTKRLAIFPSSVGMSLTKLSLAGKNKWFTAKESLVSDIPAGDGKIVNLFIQCVQSTFMCLWAIYIFPRSVRLFSCSRIGRLWAYTNWTQKHECRNWDWDRAVPFLEYNFRYSVFAVWDANRQKIKFCDSGPGSAQLFDVEQIYSVLTTVVKSQVAFESLRPDQG